MPTNLSKSYRVREGESVTLKITIGHAQKGLTSVDLDDEELVHRHEGTLERTISAEDSLAGKTLYCLSTVTDINPETNNTSVTYELIGGVTDFKQTLQTEGGTDEGRVNFYTAVFDFYLP